MNHVFTSSLKSPIGFWTVKANETHVLSISHSIEKPESTGEENKVSQLACTQLQEYFDLKRTEFDLPLAVQPYSAFFQMVWQKLLNIPFGKTTSYLDIAKKMNNPNAVRAVGMANGRNPFPIVVPCHRVIGSDKSLTGYASGLEVKKWLLVHEGAIGMQKTLF